MSNRYTYPAIHAAAPGADEEIVVPASIFDRLRPNALRKRRWSMVSPDISPEYEGMSVRIALLRHPDFPLIGAPQKITCSKDIADLCAHLASYDQEHVVVVALGSQNDVRAIYEVGIGTPSKSLLLARDVIKVALLTGSMSIVLVHNHPGGDPQPSTDDNNMTKKLVQALDCVGATLMDHVIVAQRGHYSFANNDLL